VTWWRTRRGVEAGDLVSVGQLRPGWLARGDDWDAECDALAEIGTAAVAAGDLLEDAVARLGAAGDLLLPLEQARAAVCLTAALEQIEHVQALVGRVALAMADPDAHAVWRDAVRASALAEAARLNVPAAPGR
jgi:hypothetical protein